jgi:hypothetical protein
LFRVPHLIREPAEPHNQIGDADIVDLWAGFARQVCTKQETLGVKFPPTRPGQEAFAVKSTFIGATILLNSLLYDHE